MSFPFLSYPTLPYRFLPFPVLSYPFPLFTFPFHFPIKNPYQPSSTTTILLCHIADLYFFPSIVPRSHISRPEARPRTRMCNAMLLHTHKASSPAPFPCRAFKGLGKMAEIRKELSSWGEGGKKKKKKKKKGRRKKKKEKETGKIIHSALSPQFAQ